MGSAPALANADCHKTAKSPYGSRVSYWALVDNEAVKADRGQKWAEKRLDRGKILLEPSSSDRSQ